MNQSEFENLMATAIEAYRTGHPVVVISNEDAAIHGREFLESVRDLEMPLDAAVIRGIDVERWNASDYPEILEAARRLFMEGTEWHYAE